MAGDYEAVNVNVQTASCSPLDLYRRLLALRRDAPALASRAYTPVYHDEHLLAYRRDGDDQALLVVLNLSAEQQTFDLGAHGEAGRLLLATVLDREEGNMQGVIEVRGHEGLIIQL